MLKFTVIALAPLGFLLEPVVSMSRSDMSAPSCPPSLLSRNFLLVFTSCCRGAPSFKMHIKIQNTASIFLGQEETLSLSPHFFLFLFSKDLPHPVWVFYILTKSPVIKNIYI